MDKSELERRTKAFALRVIRFVASLSKNRVNDVLGYQFLKAGTSVGANYREANRGESRSDFIHKIGVVEKEAAESQYWLELFEEAKIGDETDRQWLLKEATELLAIFYPYRQDSQGSPRRMKGTHLGNSQFAIRNPSHVQFAIRHSQFEIP